MLAIHWYFRYRRSAVNVRDLLAERHIDVSARTILNWAHKFGPLLADVARRVARPVGTTWWCDETYVRVGGQWAYLYRAIDEHGQVVDGVLRAHRDLPSAKDFFKQASARRRASPCEVITDKHQAYSRAVREEAPGARHVRTGLHRATGPTTKPIERAHIPIKDRLRPMRGLQSLRTGQQLLEGIEVAQAIRRGDIRSASADRPLPRCPYVRAREAVATFTWLAHRLCQAA